MPTTVPTPIPTPKQKSPPIWRLLLARFCLSITPVRAKARQIWPYCAVWRQRCDQTGTHSLADTAQMTFRARRSAFSPKLASFRPRNTKGYAGTAESPVSTELEVPLSDYGETLRPDFAVRELEPKDGASAWQLLVRVLEPEENFDRVVRGSGQLEASAHGRMERLLRQSGVPAGLLFNGRALRLLSAPRGESSGWIDFRMPDMVQAAGRPISIALRLLLGQARLLSMPRGQRLAALLEDSRKFQNEVSERLAEQVLHALRVAARLPDRSGPNERVEARVPPTAVISSARSASA
jgi:hypothetical protein